MDSSVKNVLKKGLIVSCQALENEPLHSPFIMSKMALAAKEGGAIAIRANSGKDIAAIKKEVNLPIIGIVKKDYVDSEIYITPTIKEVEEVVAAESEIVALDATDRLRPGNLSLEQFVATIRREFPGVYLMADCSTYEEGVFADKIGFDLVATTLCGYTPYTKEDTIPNMELIEQLSKTIETPIIAEGGICFLEDAIKAYNAGAYSLVIGSAITRPRLITERFVKAISL